MLINGFGFDLEFNLFSTERRIEWFEESARHLRANDRNRISGAISHQEKWNNVIDGLDRSKGLAMVYWKTHFPESFGLLGFKDLTEGEKLFNRQLSDWLMNEKNAPFLHKLREVSASFFVR